MEPAAAQTWIFWLALALPGYVIVQHFRDHLGDDDDRGGLLGTLGLSYLGSLLLLSPVSIICYVLGLPLAVFSTVIVLAVIASLVVIVRSGWWKRAGALLVAGFSVELIILLFDLFFGARVGAFIDGGDFRVHVARMRWITDHGFGNVDPFISGDFFFPAYHTNLLHALYASCAQLTATDTLIAHYASLPWAKLLAACGAYCLAWSVFRRRWVAWAAVAFAIGAHGTIIFNVYPNKIAALWLIPTMIAALTDGIAGECRWRTPVLVGACALILAQVHGLFAGFAVVLLTPVIVVAAAIRIVGKAPDRWRVCACALVLVVVAPFLIASRAGLEQRGEQASVRARTKDEVFARLDNGWRVRKLGTAAAVKYSLLGAAALAALLTARRRHAAPLVGVAAVGAAILFVPPLCSAALSFLGRAWILDRLSFVPTLAFGALGPGVVAYLLADRLKPPWARPVISLVLLFVAIAYAGRGEQDSWSRYLATAVDRTPRTGLLAGFADMQKTLETIPAGETILIDDKFGPEFVMLHDLTLASNSTTSQGVPGMRERRLHVQAMLANATPWEQRRELLRRYGIRYMIVFPRTPKAWLVPERVKSRHAGRTFDIVELNVQ